MASWDAIEMRKEINRGIFQMEPRVEKVHTIRNLVVPGESGTIPLRVYCPTAEITFPMLMYIHGAGWVAGNLDTHDPVCRMLAKHVPCTVVSVDYRLAPEHKFPTALEDCYRALRWCVQQAEHSSDEHACLAVGGDSAGGNLAAALCLLLRERGGAHIDFQMLVNPALDFTGYEGDEFEEMHWFGEQYLSQSEDWHHPYASPLQAEDLSGLPPAFILTGALDELCAEGEAYAGRLREAGVEANVYRQYDKGHLAGSFAQAALDADEAVEICTAVLRSAFKRFA